MRLAKYLHPDLVVLDVRGEGRDDVLHTLAEGFGKRFPDAPLEEIEQALRAREDIHSTVLGEGIAVPHATWAGLHDPAILVGVAETPLQFGPPDTDPVKLFFVLLSPPGKANQHIKLLARICRIARRSDFTEKLGEADSPDEAVDFIIRVDEAHV